MYFCNIFYYNKYSRKAIGEATKTLQKDAAERRNLWKKRNTLNGTTKSVTVRGI